MYVFFSSIVKRQFSIFSVALFPLSFSSIQFLLTVLPLFETVLLCPCQYYFHCHKVFCLLSCIFFFCIFHFILSFRSFRLSFNRFFFFDRSFCLFSSLSFFFFILSYFAELALCVYLYLFILIDFVEIFTSFSGFSLS